MPASPITISGKAYTSMGLYKYVSQTNLNPSNAFNKNGSCNRLATKFEMKMYETKSFGSYHLRINCFVSSDIEFETNSNGMPHNKITFNSTVTPIFISFIE